MAEAKAYSADVLAEAFWGSVVKGDGDSCWLWQGRCTDHGYGMFQLGTRYLLAHRVAYAMEFGGVPAGQLVRHECDTPACVRPGHLLLGTQADNMRDRDERGRTNTGPGSLALCKLTPDQVREIRRSAETGRALAARFDVSPATVSMARRGITHAGVEG